MQFSLIEQDCPRIDGVDRRFGLSVEVRCDSSTQNYAIYSKVHAGAGITYPFHTFLNQGGNVGHTDMLHVLWC